MSSESTKRRVKRNTRFLKGLSIGVILVNFIAVVGYKLFRKSFISPPLIITTALEIFLLGVLAYLVAPTIIKTSKGVEIKDGGVDLYSRGVIRIFIDIIYISSTTKIASILFNSKAFIAMLVVPITAYYEIFMRREVRLKQRQ